ncbi:MAG: hypothetical protein JST75_04325 [Bacteroidetes bacterium]|nr:hypothetical protein [Bacteroidota bacterium]
MDKFEELHIKIANYLDNLMSPSEEESFMQELSTDTDLRKLYEDELMLRAIFQQGEIKSEQQVKVAPVLLLWRKYKIAAIFLLTIISASVLYLILNKKNKEQEKAVTDNTVKKQTPINDSITKEQKPSELTQNIAGTAFNEFYKSYSSESDPVEISNYYNNYKEHKYDLVIAAKESDYQTMGIDDKNELLKQYMHLYKGLSWLEKNEPAKAVQQFDSVSSSPKNKTVFFEAQWYSVLAFLKNNNITKASEVTKKIIQTNSPHKRAAIALLKQMNL